LRLTIGVLLLFILCGCSKLGNLDKLLTLKELAEYQEATDAHVLTREQVFLSLLEDVDSGAVDQLQTQHQVLSRYGDPIFVERTVYHGQQANVWMYRLPVKFIGSDQVFFYFDLNDQVIAYDVQRSQE